MQDLGSRKIIYYAAVETMVLFSRSQLYHDNLKLTREISGCHQTHCYLLIFFFSIYFYSLRKSFKIIKFQRRNAHCKITYIAIYLMFYRYKLTACSWERKAIPLILLLFQNNQVWKHYKSRRYCHSHL